MTTPDSTTRYRSGSFIQSGETKERTAQIEQRALQIIDNVDSTGLAPAYRQGNDVLVADGMDGFTLAECQTTENAEIICLLWNHARDTHGLAQKLAQILKVKIR